MKLMLSFSIMQHQYRNSLSLPLNVQSIDYVFNFITVYTNVYMTSYIYFITTYSSDPSPKITNIWLWNFSFNGVISLEYLNLVEWRFYRWFCSCFWLGISALATPWHHKSVTSLFGLYFLLNLCSLMKLSTAPYTSLENGILSGFLADNV